MVYGRAGIVVSMVAAIGLAYGIGEQSAIASALKAHDDAEWARSVVEMAPYPPADVLASVSDEGDRLSLQSAVCAAALDRASAVLDSIEVWLRRGDPGTELQSHFEVQRGRLEQARERTP